MNDADKMSRRNFLGVSSLTGLGMMLGGSNLMASEMGSVPFIGESMGVKHKIGVIGCGNRSKAILGALNNVPEFEIVALCDIVSHKMEQRAKLIKSSVKPKFVNSLDKLLEMDEIEAIFVITPNYTHKDIVCRSMEAGKHVWCEKPMALTVEECNEMIGTAERTGMKLQIGTQRRHSPEYLKLIDVIRNKPVGQIRLSNLFDYRGDWRVPEADEYPKGTPYWRLIQAQSGGIAFEMGAHIIDVNNWVFDSEPVSVMSMQGVNNFSLRKRDSSDNAGILVEYANGAVMNYGGCCYNYGGKKYDTFMCVNATVQMGGGEISISYGTPNGFPKRKDLPKNEVIKTTSKDPAEGDGVTNQLRHYAKVLDKKELPFPNGYQARASVQIMEGSCRSALERRTIDVKELG